MHRRVLPREEEQIGWSRLTGYIHSTNKNAGEV